MKKFSQISSKFEENIIMATHHPDAGTYFKMPNTIKHLEDSDLGDNLLYYDYSTKHLASLSGNGYQEEDQAFMSSYRSFEGEVFENYIYEKLVRYAAQNQDIVKFIAKGPQSKKRTHEQPKTLSVNWKGQIVYRTKRNEINEFDALFFTETECFFVEMTLVKSVTKLKRRLRKKKALLETIFPQYVVKTLLILNEGVVGLKQLPTYSSVWVTKPYTARKVFERLIMDTSKQKEKFKRINSKCIVGTDAVKITPFRYYEEMNWLLRRIRDNRRVLLDMNFLNEEKATRTLELFTKFYIGYMDQTDFEEMVPNLSVPVPERVYVSVEKDHTGALILMYFLPHSRKKLDNVLVTPEKVTVAKKDPFGITVTEIAYIKEVMLDRDKLSIKNIELVKKILAQNSPERKK